MRYELVKIGNSPNWYVQWFEDGHSRRTSTRTRSRPAAEAFLAAFQLEAEANPTGPVLLSEVLDWYLNTRGKQIKAPATAEYAVAHLKRIFGSTLAETVGLAKQDAYAAHRRSEGVGDSTIARELNVLSAALQRAARHERIAKAPAVLQLPKAPARERWLTRDEVARIFRHLRTQKRAKHVLLFARLALYTGARTGALLDLTWDRVDLERGLIVLARPGEVQTSKRRPPVPLEPQEVRALKAAKRKSTSDHVISWRGEGVDRIVRAFRSHMRAIGLDDVTPHTLRHTFATWAARKDQSLFAIGGVLGQSVTATTERYAKHQLDAFREVTRAVRRK